MAQLTFIEKVAEYAQLPEDQAASLTEATLLVLGRRISGGQALDLAARMPDPLGPLLTRGEEDAEAFSFDEFIERVATASGVGPDIARRAVAGVMHAMRANAGHKEFEDLRAQLPGEFAQLLPVGDKRR